MGVEPDDFGVAHRRVTATLHPLGGLARDLISIAGDARGAAGDLRVGWVGIEPTSGRIKSPLQSLRLLPTQGKGLACHRGEARRGRGGCGARRRVGTLARRDQVAPPSGVEPEPLGLQPSAQTNYARVGCWCSLLWAKRAPWRSLLSTKRAPLLVPCRAPIVIALRLSEIARRAQGAPRAVMPPRFTRSHLSRFQIPS